MPQLSTKEINKKLDNAFDEVIDWVNTRSEDQLNEIMHKEKWTAAGHVFHLVKTTKAISNGMNVPKLALRLKFGINKRKERSYDELVNEFDDLVAKNGKFVAKDELSPAEGRKFKKEEIIKRFRDEQRDFKAALLKWDEKKLSKYLLPHPVVGKLTLREFAYFNVMHTLHHLGILKRDYC